MSEDSRHREGFYKWSDQCAYAPTELVCVVIEVTLDVDERCALIAGT